MDKEVKATLKIIGSVVSIILVLILGIKSCTTIHTGEAGVVRTFGKINTEALQPGLHFVNPITDSVDKHQIREIVFSDKTECFTKDTQAVNIDFSVTYSVLPNKIVDIVSEAGANWEQVLLTPAIYGRLKDVTGQYVSDELVMKRSEVKSAVLQHIQEKVKSKGIVITTIEFTNIEFNKQYQQAVEAKTVAVQHALQAKNKTVEIQEQANQKVITAKAEAEEIKIKSAALAASPKLIQFEAVKKWDGHLSQVMGNSNGMIFNLPLVGSKE